MKVKMGGSQPEMNVGCQSKVRVMKNGNYSIPFSVGFAIRKIHNFDPETVSVDVFMDIYVYFKFTGAKDLTKVMTYVTEELKMKVNEEEMPLSDPAVGRSEWKLTSSLHNTND